MWKWIKNRFRGLNLLITLATLAIIIVSIAFVYKFCISPRDIEVSRVKTLYQYDDVQKEDIKVYVSPLFGNKREVHDYTLSDTKLDKETSIVTIKYGSLTKQVSLICTPYTKTVIKYNDTDTIYMGDEIDKNKLSVKFRYDDGKVRAQKDFELLNKYFESDLIKVKTSMGEAEYRVEDFVGINKITLSPGYHAYAGDTVTKNYFEDSLFTIKYYDFSEKTVTGKEFEAEEIELLMGYNRVFFMWHNCKLPCALTATKKQYSLSVQALNDLKVGEKLKLKSIEVRYSDGKVEDIDINDIKLKGNKKMKYGANNYSFEYNGSKYEFTLNAVEREIIDFRIEDDTQWYEGDTFNINKATVKLEGDKIVQVNGSDLAYSRQPLKSGDNNINVSYHGQSYTITVYATSRDIVSIEMNYKKAIYAGQKLPNCTWTIKYSNNTVETVRSERLQFSVKELAEGVNTVLVTYNGQSLNVKIRAYKNGISKTVIVSDRDFIAGEPLYNAYLTIYWRSGDKEKVKVDNIRITSGNINKLEEGINEFTYIYGGYEGKFKVTAYTSEDTEDDTSEKE